MTRLQKMVLKPKEQLVSRLFLSPKLRQNLTVLSYSTHDLIKAMKELSASDPFVLLREPQSDAMQNLEWLRAPEGENLVDHLLMQVDLSDWHDWEKRAVKMLIYHLDEDGYLRVSLTKIIEHSEFSLENLTRAKKLLQSLDPCGIGAADLNECLLLQARHKPHFNPVALEILLNKQLEILADPDQWHDSVFSETELTAALASIQTLDPTPASDYVTGKNTQYLLPDLIYKVNDGHLMIENLQSQIPEMVFDEQAFNELKEQADENKYFSQQKQRYEEMKNAIAERQKTIMRLGEFVGQFQYEFLTTMHKKELKPLGLKETAQALNLAPSTISRAIKDKYIQCQNKIFSFKMLFPREVTTDLSQARVEYDLCKIIRKENTRAPLSDQQLVEIFAKHDVFLSRRVIAKYRNKLKIPNSYARRAK